jgi:hypothetical protein
MGQLMRLARRQNEGHRAQARQRSRKLWSHTRPASGPGLRACPVPLGPFSGCPGCFLKRADAGAVQKRHLQLDTALLGQEQQALPHAQARPADEEPAPDLIRGLPARDQGPSSAGMARHLAPF